MLKPDVTISVVLLLFSAALSLGCSHKDPRARNLVRVHGKVLLDAAPLVDASLKFHPFEENEFVHAAVGKARENGRFNITTFLPEDGIHPGKYRVAVISEEITNALPPEKILEMEAKGMPVPLPIFKSLIPKRYNDPETSGIVVEVPRQGKKDILIELHSK